jgi:4-hydroxybenzoate polyprenyltransferase
MKGQPVFGSMLHFVGGTLHFMLGYAAFSALDARSIAIGCFFGLVFAAGHLSHETRGWEGDRLNGIRTNAVAFGKLPSFLASLTLFTAAYALLVLLALYGVVARMLALAVVLYLVQLYLSLQAIRAGLSRGSLQQAQWCYRLLYAVVGVAMAATAPVILHD